MSPVTIQLSQNASQAHHLLIVLLHHIRTFSLHLWQRAELFSRTMMQVHEVWAAFLLFLTFSNKVKNAGVSIKGHQTPQVWERNKKPSTLVQLQPCLGLFCIESRVNFYLNLLIRVCYCSKDRIILQLQHMIHRHHSRSYITFFYNCLSSVLGHCSVWWRSWSHVEDRSGGEDAWSCSQVTLIQPQTSTRAQTLSDSEKNKNIRIISQTGCKEIQSCAGRTEDTAPSVCCGTP